MAKFNSKKWKKSSFYEEKSLVGLTPEGNQTIAIFNSLRRSLSILAKVHKTKGRTLFVVHV